MDKVKKSDLNRKIELTASDLCIAMLARGDRFVVCLDNEKEGRKRRMVMRYEDGKFICLSGCTTSSVTPIDLETWSILTAKEVGL